MSGRTFLNASAITAGSHLVLPDDLTVPEKLWWNDKLGEKGALQNDFTFFHIQDKSTEDIEVRLNGNKTENRYIQGQFTGSDDSGFFETLVIVNKDAAAQIEIGELIIFVDRPFQPLKKLLSVTSRILERLGVSD